ncbi:hypothetical protein [Novosphingobium sp. Fuku2-ISO-50]|uniref:hypothetical protein n=1 Tax=Novosphingobium sp. Fuku2-ISO-50 TaxID=1739114 RepID=UPI0012E38D94|nr:hypothetical protein [Novosphingobium sp. Fuku2-ISO-50]
MMSGHNTSASVSFYVDPAAGTVNGLSAAITDAQIRWNDATSRNANTTVIDRATGGIVTLSSRNIPLLTGNCQLATSRQF